MRTWLAPKPSTDVERAVRVMHVHQYLALYEHVAEQADEPQAIEQAQALQSAMDAGDRPTIELFAVERCHDD